MNNSVFILCKQDQVTVERLHICTWDISKAKYFTEYGVEIKRGELKTLNLAIALPKIKDPKDCICLYPNISEINNCRFIFNSDIEEIKPIDGNPQRGNNVKFREGRKITILPIGNKLELLEEGVLQIELNIPEQACEIVYFRFLVKSKEPAFSSLKKEVSTKIITYDVRVNECRTASSRVQEFQDKYNIINVEKCFCFHIMPNTYTVDFLDGNKLKTIRGLETDQFDSYLKKTKEAKNINLKSQEYNIVFCKQEGLPNYSFFSVYRKEYIGNSQLILALGANLFCSLLFALGSLHPQTPNISFFDRIPVEYWVACGVFVALLVGYCWKRRK